MTIHIGMLVREPALALLARVNSVSHDRHVFLCVPIARKRSTSICITSRCTVSLPMSKRMKKTIDSLPREHTGFGADTTNMANCSLVASCHQIPVRFAKTTWKRVDGAPLQVDLHLRPAFCSSNRLIHFQAANLSSRC